MIFSHEKHRNLTVSHEGNDTSNSTLKTFTFLTNAHLYVVGFFGG